MKGTEKANKVAKTLLTPGKSLGAKTIKGTFWIVLLRIFERGFQFVRTLVLARMLAPKDFGVYGIAMLVLASLETFTETGFGRAIIQQKTVSRKELDSAWTVHVLKSVLIAVLLFALAPLLARFFGSPESEQIIKIIGVGVVLIGLTNIDVVRFEKSMRFNKLFQYRVLGSVTELVVSIVAAIITRSPMALVIGLLAGNAVRCIMSFVVSKYRPRFVIDLPSIKGLWVFGKWVLGSNSLNFLLSEGDDFVVGKLLGAMPLGFYQLAYRVSNVPAREISNVVSRVTFPAYAFIQGNKKKLRGTLKTALLLTSLVSLPIAGYLFVAGHEFVVVLMGEQWAPAVAAMQLLAWCGALNAIGKAADSFFFGTGRPRLATVLQAIQTLLMFGMVIPLTLGFEFTGTAMAVFISSALIFVVRSIIVINRSELRVWHYLKPLLISICVTAISSFAVLGTGRVLQIESTSVRFGVYTFGYLVITILALAIVDKVFRLNLKHKINRIREEIKK